MITRAIVEELLTPHQVRVRIPLFDGAPDEALSSRTPELSVATVCTLPSCYVNLQVGDVVFVAFEDRTLSKVVVIGHLSRDATNTCVDIRVNALSVNSTAALPATTSIGEISKEEIYALKGASDNLQAQITNLRERLDILSQAVLASNE